MPTEKEYPILHRYIQTDFTSYEDLCARYRVNVPDGFNFAHDVVDEWARIQPDRLAMLWVNDHGEKRRFTFGEMSRLSNQAANFFASLGIRKGDKVMLILKRRYQFWYCTLGLSKLGATFIPATHLLTEHDIVYRNNAAGIKMIIAAEDEFIIPHVENSRAESPTLESCLLQGAPRQGWIDLDAGIADASPVFERKTGRDAHQNDDLFLMYFTSGTTGMPKMAAHDYTYPLGHIPTAKFWHNCDDDDLHISVADTGWAKCGWGKMFGQWFIGAAQFIYDMDKFVPRLLAEKICENKVTSFCAPPTIYRFLIKEDLSDLDFSALRHASTAGEPLNPSVFERFKQMTGLEIKEGYGQTESTPIIATYPWIKSVPGSLGMPSPSYHVELLNEQGIACEVGEIGEICIDIEHGHPVGLFTGYYRNRQATDAVWHDGFYHTGDTAWMDENGYYWFEGRVDDIIKSSGYRIGPFEVESALMTHPAVLECAISAAPDPIRGQIVKATIALAKGYSPSDALVKELQEHVKVNTAPYKYPRLIDFVDELPKTISGKIKRKEIRDKDLKERR